MIACVTDKDFVKFDAAKMNENRKKAVFKDSQGQSMELDAGKQGKYVSVSELNDYTLNAFVSTEDKRFYRHHGLDLKRIGSALIKNIFSEATRKAPPPSRSSLSKYLSDK